MQQQPTGPEAGRGATSAKTHSRSSVTTASPRVAFAPRKLTVPQPKPIHLRARPQDWRAKAAAPRTKRPVYTLNAEEMIAQAKIGDPRLPVQVEALAASEESRAALGVTREQTEAIDEQLAVLKQVTEEPVMTKEEEELEQRFQQLLFEAELAEEDSAKMSFDNLAFKKELAEQNAQLALQHRDANLFAKLKRILLFVDPESFKLDLKTILLGLVCLMGVVVGILGLFVVKSMLTPGSRAERPFVGLRR